LQLIYGSSGTDRLVCRADDLVLRSHISVATDLTLVMQILLLQYMCVLCKSHCQICCIGLPKIIARDLGLNAGVRQPQCIHVLCKSHCQFCCTLLGRLLVATMVEPTCEKSCNRSDFGYANTTATVDVCIMQEPLPDPLHNFRQTFGHHHGGTKLVKSHATDLTLVMQILLLR
jgi:hypothetical protein